MSKRKTKKEALKILKEITLKYEFEKSELDEMRILLFEFVQFMTKKEIKETLMDYHIRI